MLSPSYSRWVEPEPPPMEHCPPLSAPWASVSLLPRSSLIGPPGAAARVQLLTYVSAVGRHFSLTSLALPAQSIQKQPPLRREGRHFSRWSSPGKAWWQAWAWVQGEQWGGGGGEGTMRWGKQDEDDAWLCQPWRGLQCLHQGQREDLSSSLGPCMEGRGWSLHISMSQL